MTSARLFVAWILLIGIAWGQSPSPTPLETQSPTASATPSPTASPTPSPTASPVPAQAPAEREDFEETYRPSAQETDKPAVFGYMILARQELMEGTPTAQILRQSIGPWLLCALLLPIYWFLARRRGFRL